MDLIQLSSIILNTLIYATFYVMSKYIYRIQKQKLSTVDQQMRKLLRYKRRKLKIFIMGLPTLLCFIQNYSNICLIYTQSEKLNIFECFKQLDTEKIGMGILTSFYMTLLLYIGPVYQEFWVLRHFFISRMVIQEKNLAKLDSINLDGTISLKSLLQQQFYIKTPLIDEIIFRELVNNAVNVKYTHNLYFIIYSTFLYSISKSISYGLKKPNISRYEFLKSFVLGLYLSFVLVQTKTIITVIINHGLMNFMGRPNFRDLVKGNYTDEQRWKMIRFYFLGFVAFLIFCVLVL